MRNFAFRIQRPKKSDSGEEEMGEFSASIDGFRLQEIARALEFRPGNTVYGSTGCGFLPAGGIG
ncbi:hypothetical protein GCT19_41365 [Paraburkholderia sp. CNPSo 3155]|uniref:Uncharacterized protein n=1 Tax=Paraburkholderia atlantica TaxID=2654982 RepID=A0A6I1Q2J0_PARAM|nr:hypothetical protein [Paraburkholderia atlantica]MBB5421823.1 hypothetical protein [Paraburkholderia atlantica]MBB5429878.1 hypothetical protein [Paraburkholderia atlantica]MPW11736.1 hypothetical protein [Paraburkholderia atlantica]